MTSIAASEFDFINRVRQQTLTRHGRGGGDSASLIPSSGSLIEGIGDDAAVFRQRAGRDTVITADLLVEDIDFRCTTTPPQLLGHKALAVSLSDIAAMGAQPRWALLSVGVPAAVWASPFLTQFYDGFGALADEYGVTLVGGDVSRTPERIVIDSIVLGEAARGRAVLRSGAAPGDQLFVTGTLGGAAAGLQLLEGGARLTGGETHTQAVRRRPHSDATRARTRPGEDVLSPASSQATSLFEVRRRLMLRQLRPAPRVACGLWLAKQRLATAMIDLSDGLSSDLAHLCRAGGVGARIDAARVPVDASLKRVGTSPEDALSLALHGGEDFELLFAVRRRDVDRLPNHIGGVRITHIGEINADRGKVRLLVNHRTTILRPSGFEHFKQPRRAT